MGGRVGEVTDECLWPGVGGLVSWLCTLPCRSEQGTARARKALEALGLQPSERDCGRVQQVCRMVVSRAAALCAAGLAAVLSLMCQSRQLEQLGVSVAVDGELYHSCSR